MLLIDTHCHLDFDQFNDDRAATIERAREAGVTRMIIPAVDLHNCHDVIRVAEQFAGVYCAVGVHPNATAGWESRDLDELRGFAAHPKVVSIGEIGLDYHWDKSPKAQQQKAFIEQMILADELDLPIIIHNREASDDVISLMWASPLVDKWNAGVMHSFSATPLIARKALNLGFHLGFTGPLTFKKAQALRDISAEIPLDRILLETDAPFLTPEPKRGKRNEPCYVPHIAAKLADVRGISVEEVAAATTANAVRLFNL
jgi:TatD DNase family protein